jgi:hypothetical protein
MLLGTLLVALLALAYVGGLLVLFAFCAICPLVGLILRDTKFHRWARCLIWGPAFAGAFAALFIGYAGLAWWLDLPFPEPVPHAALLLPAGMLAGLFAGGVMAIER